MGLEGTGEGSGSSISRELPSPDQRKAAACLSLWICGAFSRCQVWLCGTLEGKVEESERLGSLNSFGAEWVGERGSGSAGSGGREGLGSAELGRGDSCGWEFTCAAGGMQGGITHPGMG